MNELNLIETSSNLDAIPLSDQTKFKLNDINKIKNFFNSKNQEIKAISEKLTEYIAAFDYTDKIFIVLSATCGGISIISLQVLLGFL